MFVNTQRQIVGSYASAYRQSAYHVNKLTFHIWMEGEGAFVWMQRIKKIQNEAAAGQFVLKPFAELCACIHLRCIYFLDDSVELTYPQWSCTSPSSRRKGCCRGKCHPLRLSRRGDKNKAWPNIKRSISGNTGCSQSVALSAGHVFYNWQSQAGAQPGRTSRRACRC